MGKNVRENLDKTFAFMRAAAGCDLIFFPEIQLTPFFPQYPGRNADRYVLDTGGPEAREICDCARETGVYASPNLYLAMENGRFDASLWINPAGEVEGASKIVHILQAEHFCERDYYIPSDDGFKVFETPWGKAGIVICFDRHLPESIRTCALMGANLVIIPAANTRSEPLEMFEWEIRVQAMQNNVFIAMCNRVGREGKMDFCGQSILMDPYGAVACRADDREQLTVVEVDLSQSERSRCPRVCWRLC